MVGTSLILPSESLCASTSAGPRTQSAAAFAICYRINITITVADVFSLDFLDFLDPMKFVVDGDCVHMSITMLLCCWRQVVGEVALGGLDARGELGPDGDGDADAVAVAAEDSLAVDAVDADGSMETLRRDSCGGVSMGGCWSGSS